jgi:hypothetical protein
MDEPESSCHRERAGRGLCGDLGHVAPARSDPDAPVSGNWRERDDAQLPGTVRRELLDHVVVLSENHLRRLLREYVAYYNAERVHTSIGDAPKGRASETKPSRSAQITRLPRVGGLQGRYAWRVAA